MKLYINNKSYEVISKPQPHVLVPTNKELHGWWPGKRECTAERMLINPYNGCGVGCFFCYTLAFPGYFQIFRQREVIIVACDFDKIVAQQLDSIDVASCGYLSPVTDPFQPLNEFYHLSEKILRVFIERNIPIEFITKAKIPQEAIEIIKQQKHSFGQVSILTPDEDLRKVLVGDGATTDTLFENLMRLSEERIYAVGRIDPIFPYIADEKRDLEELVKRMSDCGAKHIIASVLDIPLKIKNEVFETIKKRFGTGMERDYRRLYGESIDSYLNAEIGYRKSIFDFLRNICDKLDISFALCMEYEISSGQTRGLNREFMSSKNCEGINIPIYKRNGDTFFPAAQCRGECLYCVEPICGIKDLAMGREGSKKNWKLNDYRRWSKLSGFTKNKKWREKTQRLEIQFLP